MEGIKRRSLPFRFHHYLALCCISTFSVNNLRIICFNFFDRQVWQDTCAMYFCCTDTTTAINCQKFASVAIKIIEAVKAIMFVTALN